SKFYRDPPQRMSSDRVIQSWDTASKAEEINDYSVGTTWLVRNNDYYLLDVFRARMQYPELKQRVRELANLHRANSVLI
ncbi:MAG: terminase, partial [Xanthobacteraceae bacterium]